jgi:hypothetical protein
MDIPKQAKRWYLVMVLCVLLSFFAFAVGPVSAGPESQSELSRQKVLDPPVPLVSVKVSVSDMAPVPCSKRLIPMGLVVANTVPL